MRTASLTSCIAPLLLLACSSGEQGATTTGPSNTVGAVTSLTLVSGDVQTGTVGTQLRAPLVVKATDAQGRAVANATVTFSLGAGAGSVANTATATDANGLAQTTWTLGTVAGLQHGNATVGTLTTTFTATASAASAATVTLSQSSVSMQFGDSYRFVATAADAFGNQIQLPSISWASSSSSVATVDNTGLARAVGEGFASISATAGVAKANANIVVTAMNIAGTFIGQYTATVQPGVIYQGVLQLSQSGSSISGTLTTNAGRAANVAGLVSGARMTATMTFTDACGGRATSTADIVNSGRSLVGNYTISDCLGSYAGGYSLTKQ